jgi:putative Mg2+ transporter-C (MgtC) family protein
VTIELSAIGSAVPSGQGLKQLGELALAFGLSSLIGLEREWRQKSAGLRTHTLVGRRSGPVSAVRGLTTAAIGMACGAGLPILALAVTAAHFVVVFLYPLLAATAGGPRWRSGSSCRDSRPRISSRSI